MIRILFLSFVLGILGCQNHPDESNNVPAPPPPHNPTGATPPTIPMNEAYWNEKLPNISGKNPQGDSFHIRSIESKLIMLEFWASWCPPCRKASPKLVALYNKYHSQGLEIVSISLDDKHSKWEKAIKDDGLIWPYHICEYQGWESKLALQYQIEEIPNNVVYNQEGKIVAKSIAPEDWDTVIGNLLVK